MATLSERLAAKTDTSGAHHRWLGATAADGTPQIRVNGRLTTVQRVVWEQTHGILGAGVTVAACPDDPRCVRLEHLSLGRKPRQRPEADTPPRAPRPVRVRHRVKTRSPPRGLADLRRKRPQP